MRVYPRATMAALLILILLSLLLSCTVRQELTIDGNGAGTANVTVQLDPLLLSYYNDLLIAMTGVEGEYPVFDVDQIRAAFEQRPGLALTRVEVAARGRLQMEFRFDDVNEVLTREAATAAAQGVPVTPSDSIRFRAAGSRRELVMHLNRDTVNTFLSFAPPESATMTQFLFPPADGSVSESEYREELAWALEEYGPAEQVDRVLRAASIDVTVRPSGRIESQTGGTVRGGAVTFTVPILELLTLTEDREYRLVFVP